MAKIRLTDHKKQLLMFPKETVDNQITEYPILWLTFHYSFATKLNAREWGQLNGQFSFQVRNEP